MGGGDGGDGGGGGGGGEDDGPGNLAAPPPLPPVQGCAGRPDLFPRDSRQAESRSELGSMSK